MSSQASIIKPESRIVVQFRCGAASAVAGKLVLVTLWISGSPYVIVDIRMRMLKPRDLYRAQGFPDSYIIERGHNGQQFTLSQQVHMCGNSVSPNTMAAYARANDPWKLRRRSAVAA
ncbi:DNA cytosine methyltransferase [Pseudomonas aeruginosa]|nr:DNA cytosine methyltransferase [Pseudomonas aeruginosa]MDI2351977.1 DNA cytosine methyltransferase [Pseudomonas aeruginosa]